MSNKEADKKDFSFWSKHKRFAGNEILLYLIMITGIILGIIFLG